MIAVSLPVAVSIVRTARTSASAGPSARMERVPLRRVHREVPDVPEVYETVQEEAEHGRIADDHTTAFALHR